MTHIHMTTTRAGTGATMEPLISVPSASARAVYRTIASMWRNHRDLTRLRQMSDHELRDIGLDRGQIEYAVRHGRQFD